MTFIRIRNGGWELKGISEPFLSVLRQLPDHPEEAGAAAHARFFPSPTHEDPELQEDWEQHVVPELRRLFTEAREVVRKDLASLDKNDNGHLKIPRQNVEAWMHTLTQARLALAIHHDFSEAELSQPPRSPAQDFRDYARLKMEFYAALLAWLVESAD